MRAIQVSELSRPSRAQPSVGLRVAELPEPEAPHALAPDGEVIASGHVRPLIGARLPLARAAQALEIIAERRAVGKIVLEL